MLRRKRDNFRGIRTCLRCAAFFKGEPGQQYCPACKRIGEQLDVDHRRFLDAWRKAGGVEPKGDE